jgi:hypothetical protein
MFKMRRPEGEWHGVEHVSLDLPDQSLTVAYFALRANSRTAAVKRLHHHLASAPTSYSGNGEQRSETLADLYGLSHGVHTAAALLPDERRPRQPLCDEEVRLLDLQATKM